MSGFDIGGPQGLPTPKLLGERELNLAAPEGGESFGDSLATALESISELGSDTKDKAEALARGESVEVHELMVAMGKSDVAFNLMLEVRNKIVEAWNTLSRAV